MSIDRAKVKQRAYFIAVGLSLFLTIIKLTAGFLTSTWSVVAMGMDSFLDILFTNFNFFLLKIADKPADRDHPVGHGKFEEVSVVVQSIIIFLLGIFMLKEGISGLLYGSDAIYSRNVIFVMVISVIGSVIISLTLKSAGKKINSSALIADSKHYSVDIISNGSILIGLVCAYTFEIAIIDSILTSIFSFYIMFSAIQLFLPAFKTLTDHKVSDIKVEEIEKIFNSCTKIIDYHSLLAVRTGSFILITVHIIVDAELSLRDAHSIADNLEQKIKALSNEYKPTIHMDPSE